MSSDTQHFDVIISGGGLSGLLTALGLLKECPDLNLAIVEPTSANAQQTLVDNFDGRCLALSYGSLQLMNHWGIWSSLKPYAWPIKSIVTSDRGHIGKTIMKAKNYGLNAMGYVAEMRNIGLVMQQCLSQLPHSLQSKLTWFCPDKIAKIKHSADSVTLTLESTKCISGKLLVVAEGGQSPTRELLGITVKRNDYQQSAVIANVRVKGAEGKLKSLLKLPNVERTNIANHVAFERFTTNGPIAFLPIGKQTYSLVWTETPDRAAEIMALEDEAFLNALQQDFGFAAGEITSVSKRESFPLSLIKAESMYQDRVALVGNAAHTLHPIAGQGFNLGLRDIAVLVESVKQTHNKSGDIGGFDLLFNYQANRERDVNRITGFTDLLVRSFGLEGRLPAAVRTASLMALQKVESLQHWLAMQFMSSKSLTNIPQLKE